VRIREGIIRLHTTWLVFCLREKVEQVLLWFNFFFFFFFTSFFPFPSRLVFLSPRWSATRLLEYGPTLISGYLPHVYPTGYDGWLAGKQ
jgi:hypothetical protein